MGINNNNNNNNKFNMWINLHINDNKRLPNDII